MLRLSATVAPSILFPQSRSTWDKAAQVPSSGTPFRRPRLHHRECRQRSGWHPRLLSNRSEIRIRPALDPRSYDHRPKLLSSYKRGVSPGPMGCCLGLYRDRRDRFLHRSRLCSDFVQIRSRRNQRCSASRNRRETLRRGVRVALVRPRSSEYRVTFGGHPAAGDGLQTCVRVVLINRRA